MWAEKFKKPLMEGCALMNSDDLVTNIEWLGRSLSMKAQNYALGAGGQADIEWTDKCGVFQKIQGEHMKAFACLLAWGDWRDGDVYFNRVVNYLVQFTLANCAKKKTHLRDSKHTLPDFIEKMAKMVVYLHLRPVLQKVYPTTFGRLYFAGIDMDEKAYHATWKKHQMVMEECLLNWQASIDSTIGTYRRNLKNTNK